MLTFEDLEKKISYLKPDEQKLVRKAFEFAQNAHKDQKRNTGEPFIIHGLETAAFIADLRLDAASVAAAILHDTCEDTPCSLGDIRKHFGRQIAFLVDGVTKLGKIRILRRWLVLKDEKELQEFDRQVETLRKMFLAMARDIRIIIIKLADRLHNMQTLQGVAPEKRERIAQETLEIYAPLADRLGMGQLKGQLEDLAFSYLEKEECEKLKKLIANRLDRKEKYIVRLKKVLLKKLAKEGIKAEVSGRAKHFYSLYLKLKRYDNDISRIYDLVAIRVIVSTVEECYQVLGIIHKMWRPLVGRIKDYIAMPKPNGYQSIHTTVFADQGELIEIQIRTRQMHDQAENGIAAHWHYSQKKSTLDYLRRRSSHIPAGEIQWVKELARWQGTLADNREMLDSLGLDFFSDRIFVYTPTGDVKDLPVGATAIDFAYAVHTDLGNSITGAKINGRMDKISTTLKNGDIVEIIKGKKPAPKRDWLEVVKTSLARSRIRHWFRKEK